MLVRQVLLNEVVDDQMAQTVVAEFWMDGNALRSSYALPMAQQILEGDGVSVLSGVLRPQDGRAFFDALPAGLSYGSMLTTRDVLRAAQP